MSLFNRTSIEGHEPSFPLLCLFGELHSAIYCMIFEDHLAKLNITSLTWECYNTVTS